MVVGQGVLNQGVVLSGQKESNQSDIKSIYTVVKRNGMLVPFSVDRIFMAIEAAFRSTKGISADDPLSKDDFLAVKQTTSNVVEKALLQAKKGECLTVEGIQDIVEQELMEGGHYQVAKNYIIYRDEHKKLREDSPRNLKILRRDGKTLVRFNPMKIASAIEKAFRATRKIQGTSPKEVIDAVNLLTNKVVGQAVKISKDGQQLHIELIQDEIEKQMMLEGFFQEAKDFIIYRAKRAEARSRQDKKEGQDNESQASVIVQEKVAVRQDGLQEKGRVFKAKTWDNKDFTITEDQLRQRIYYACKGMEDVIDPEEILQESIKNFYDGIREDEIDKSNILAARVKIEKDPAYSYAAARILLDVIYREVLEADASNAELENIQRCYFVNYIKNGVELNRLSDNLLSFDLEKLAKALDLSRDKDFTYLGIQTLYDRYFIHHNERRLETPQIFWMRVAMGLAINEGQYKEDRAIEFYNILSQFYFISSTPTLFNSGTKHSQLSSCYLSTVMDDLQHIFKVISDDAQLSKWAGGLGNDWTNVRATGAWIKGTNGKSQGVIPFLKVANDTAVAVNQGGKRKGAMCAYLESWHLDIEDFLELRKNTGDERRRTHDMNTANWIPDLFIKRVINKESWTLFSPDEVPDLHDLYGKAFEKRYVEYETMAEEGKIRLYKKVDAVSLWRKMLSMLYETGHPWITFKDPSNIRSPQDHVGVVHSSNLCTEILLNTSKDETAVCNLGSINLVKHLTSDGQINEELLAKTIKSAIRMLDNVIDINYYPTSEARNANLKHRPVGLGIMGFVDALYANKISYASPEAVEFADRSMEMVSYYAILSSAMLAKERGAYPSYQGSKWSRGILPIDSLRLLQEERGKEYVDLDFTSKMDWDKVRKAISEYGIRNSNCLAIAPTATISNITGVSQSIEPSYKHLFVKSNLSGEFTVVNTYLVEDLKKLGLWDDEMIDDLKYFDGSILEIERIPEEIKKIYLTAFEIEPEWLIECAARRQKWIDMGQSLNLYIAEPSGKKLNAMYIMAWKKGLKTTYYLRSLGATQIEKSTLDINRRGLQPRWMKNKSASSEIVVQRATRSEQSLTSSDMPKVCGLDGECESCQ